MPLEAAKRTLISEYQGYHRNVVKRPSYLDSAAATVPAAAALARSSINSSGTVLADPEDAQEGRHEPEQCREEGEGDVGLELAALVAGDGVDVVPVEDVAARVAEQLDAHGQSLILTSTPIL